MVVIVAFPSAMPLTNPVPSTVATAVSLDVQVKSAFSARCPLASNASATILRVSPATSVAASGETVTAPTTCATAIVAVPDADPAVAVIVATPLPIAVTRPAALTVATCAAVLDQVTVTPAIDWPFWSRTSAAS